MAECDAAQTSETICVEARERLLEKLLAVSAPDTSPEIVFLDLTSNPNRSISGTVPDSKDTKRRQYKAWTSESMVDAIIDYRTVADSIVTTAKRHNVPKSTLDRLVKREDIKEAIRSLGVRAQLRSTIAHLLDKKRLLSDVEEEDVVKEIIHQYQKFTPWSTMHLRMHVAHLKRDILKGRDYHNHQ